jgi:hypothetical protein
MHPHSETLSHQVSDTESAPRETPAASYFLVVCVNVIPMWLCSYRYVFAPVLTIPVGSVNRLRMHRKTRGQPRVLATTESSCSNSD